MRRMPERVDTDRMIAMTDIAVALLSANEFEIARRFIPELLEYRDYDDWLDCRYGRFMGCSLGGLDAGLITVRLEEFLNWCRNHHIAPSEPALDEFSRHAERPAEDVGLAA
jgi:hypothetical protein